MADNDYLREDRKNHQHEDVDPQETREWLDALETVFENEGVERVHFLIETLIDKARRSGAYLPYKATTAYLNTIPVTEEERNPGDPELEERIRAYTRWNAMAMVVQANRGEDSVGGHIASFASCATLYDVAFNHFWRGPDHPSGGDLVYFQGHASPGVYARAFLEGRLTEDQLANFRREIYSDGVTSYPHPWLMPDFWQFPTVSMGLGPMTAVYQARFMKYLHNRGIIDAKDRKVWAMLGDGEMDEPESLGAISLAAREKLDNLIFVINCNLQRLDGPVRGNGKIMQELEGVFRGAGWRVIKVVWGDRWDPLLARDKSGLLVRRMEEAVDGDYQNYAVRPGSYTREHFFGKYPELKKLVANLTDYDIKKLNRGGHDPQKIYAAYAEAVRTEGRPVCILAKTVKGYGMGEAGEGQNVTHQIKKMGESALKAFRDRYRIPIPDEEVKETPFYKPAEDSPEMEYLRKSRKKLGGPVPSRKTKGPGLKIPDLDMFKNLLESTGDREVSTTMAFVRTLQILHRQKELGRYVVPIVPDEARTFGMDGLFRNMGIYSSVGQVYEPVDIEQVLYYNESKDGQILEEGITEAGSISSWIAAGTAYSNYGINMIPFFIFYSMFGFQRVGDLVWLAADAQARGFLLGGTAGRTTLFGEGLQHQDGHSHIAASWIPNCRAYDPCWSYELAVIIHDGMKKMIEEQENAFYYITVGNENYAHPEMPEGVEDGIIRGMYLFREGEKSDKLRVQLLGSGTILREVLAAADLLREEYGVESDVWSVTSFTELRRDGMDVHRWNRLHPKETPRTAYVTEQLSRREGPVVASTDWITLYPDHIRQFVPHNYYVLGTDGFGRSDTRENLRRFFEVDRHHVAVTALKALADEEKIAPSKVAEAIEKYNIDTERVRAIYIQG